MATPFKMPFLKNRNAASIEGVPVFDVGRGSFGEVFTTDFNFTGKSGVETVVVKKALGALDGEEKRLFLKEMALLHKLKHSNVVHLKALCYRPCAFMMEYVYFSFSPFGDDSRVSSLGDLLLHIDAEYRCEGFEQLIAFATGEVVRGLSYLHGNGVAHRDLKPVNILVSNQHYCSTSKGEIAREFSLRPVVCKLII